MALDATESLDLLAFQHFIHHRAYRKLGSRVEEFMTHWGALPFDILLAHLDPTLRTHVYTFAYKGLAFHTYFAQYVTLTPDMIHSKTELTWKYCVNAANASQWINALKELWGGLVASLLVKKKREVGRHQYIPRSSHCHRYGPQGLYPGSSRSNFYASLRVQSGQNRFV